MPKTTNWPYSNWRDEEWEREAQKHTDEHEFEPEMELEFNES